MFEAIVSPFFSAPDLGRALLAGLLLAIATAPLGVFLILRRMSLIGDAFGHAILPGAAGAAMLSGGATWAISLGAALTGASVFISATVIGRFLRLPEDAGFALFFLTALAIGVLISSTGHSHIHLDDLLFGKALALDNTALILASAAALLSLLGMRLIYRPLMLDTLDSAFLAQVDRGKISAQVAQAVFFALLALASVTAFHALGALMAVGITIVPAIAARFWARSIPAMMLAAGIVAALGVFIGLLAAHHSGLAPGASIILSLVVLAFASAIGGPLGSVLARAGLFGHKPGSKVATSNT